MVGLALEGGGSRGAYQVGVVKAYLEAGYRFDGYVGTSIGAINAAAFAQGDFEKAEEMWLSLTTSELFNSDARKLLEIGKNKWSVRYLRDVRKGLRKIIEEHGIDTSKIKSVIAGFIDEERVRASGCDYGLVTVSVNEKKPYELFLRDIQEGLLLPYIEASSCVPGFQPVVIGENTFTDGALYNSCPINMLVRENYTEIIAVRTKAPGVYRRIKAPKNVTIKVIKPRRSLGNMLIFSPEKIKENIGLGYLDGLKSLKESNRNLPA